MRPALRYTTAVTPARLASEGVRVALVLAATDLLHDTATGAWLIVALTAPSVVAAPLIGALLDAARRPGLVFVGAGVILAAALAVAAGIGSVPVPVLLVVLFVGGWAMPVFVGGASSFVGGLMPGETARGFAFDALSYNIASVGGPAVVALIAAFAGPRIALLVLAALVVAGAVMFSVLPLRPHEGADRAVVASVVAGTRYLASHRPLALATAASTITQIGGGAIPVAAVAVALTRGQSASGAGLLLTAFAVGGLAGAGVAAVGPVARLLRAAPPQPVMAVSFALTGLLTLVAAALPGFPLVLVAFVLAGLPTTPGVAALFRVRQDESPADLRAQVFTVGGGLRVAAAAVGAALAGLIAGAPAAVLLLLVAVPWVAAGALLLVPARRPGDSAR